MWPWPTAGWRAVSTPVAGRQACTGHMASVGARLPFRVMRRPAIHLGHAHWVDRPQLGPICAASLFAGPGSSGTQDRGEAGGQSPRSWGMEEGRSRGGGGDGGSPGSIVTEVQGSAGFCCSPPVCPARGQDGSGRAWGHRPPRYSCQVPEGCPTFVHRSAGSSHPKAGARGPAPWVSPCPASPWRGYPWAARGQGSWAPGPSPCQAAPLQGWSCRGHRPPAFPGPLPALPSAPHSPVAHCKGRALRTGRPPGWAQASPGPSLRPPPAAAPSGAPWGGSLAHGASRSSRPDAHWAQHVSNTPGGEELTASGGGGSGQGA